MADMGGAEQRSTAQLVTTRLWNSRWLLAAGIVAVLTVYGFADTSGYVVLLACAVLLLAAAMLPASVARQSAEDAAAIEAGGLQ
ncbi:MAG: two-component sensor histidine kinase, partial [Mesorhizobium sp.]